MSEIDKFYTPKFISDIMIKAAGKIDAKLIADFASGDGSLLSSASKKWIDASFFANDICINSTIIAEKNIQNCLATNANFLDAESIMKNGILKRILSKCDLILLNPPYSYRGQYCISIHEYETRLSCPKSIAFLINALPFLSPSGKIIALMPEGAIRGERSRNAINFISEKFKIKMHDSFKANSFKDCNAKTVIISVAHKNNKRKITKKELIKSNFNIVRGNTAMFKVGKSDDNKIPIIHSTSLTENGIVLHGENGIGISHIVESPVVLIQRVGKIKKHKVVLYTGAQRVSISDCIFAIDVPSEEAGNMIVSYIHDNWESFRQEYIGTCAQFITLERLHGFLSKIPSERC